MIMYQRKKFKRSSLFINISMKSVEKYNENKRLIFIEIKNPLFCIYLILRHKSHQIGNV